MLSDACLASVELILGYEHSCYRQNKTDVTMYNDEWEPVMTADSMEKKAVQTDSDTPNRVPSPKPDLSHKPVNERILVNCMRRSYSQI